jgi:predicted phosphodiesterase
MVLRIYLAVVCLMVWLSMAKVEAHEARTKTQAIKPKTPPVFIAHPPSPIPDRIILTWADSPTTTQSVTWRTDATTLVGYGQIAVASADPNFVKKAETVMGKTTLLVTDQGSANYHSVSFVGLKPSTKYAYRVGDGVHWSEWNHFRTASEKPEPFTFLYFGDAQNDIKSLWSRVIREAYSEASKARFIVHAGDLVNNANRDAQWGEWHEAAGWVNAMVPSVPTPGNHEYEKAGEKGKERSYLSRHWRPQFTLPENGLASLEETCYYFDFQGVRIISLNSNEFQKEQAVWLESVLSNNPNRWTILTFHHPIFSSAKGRDNASLRSLWKPLFDKYRVDLVLQGHDHTYARSNMRVGMNARDVETGTIYVVSVSGPKMYNVEKQAWMRRAAEDTQLYQVISIDGDRLRFEARTATGMVYDAFDLRKQTDAPNRLIERVPRGVRENLRVPKTP